MPRTLSDQMLGNKPYEAGKWMWLEAQNNLSPPGQVVRYSNLGYDLLADALATATGESFTKALRDYVLDPVGMGATTSLPTKDQCAQLMQGVSPQSCDDQTPYAGSGGEYSTSEDMAKWIRYQLDDKSASSFPVNELSHAIYVQRQVPKSVDGLDIAGRADGVGLGWIWLQPGSGRPGMLEKTGGGGGFMSYVVLVPGRSVGIFIAVTKVDVPMLTRLTSGANKLASSLAISN
jgi:D-alanyl-D-alanine-carboxypeptidase/D-alanyl-D-alanine-endopeptidase